jgi:hypothetical protein
MFAEDLRRVDRARVATARFGERREKRQEKARKVEGQNLLVVQAGPALSNGLALHVGDHDTVPASAHQSSPRQKRALLRSSKHPRLVPRDLRRVAEKGAFA